MAKSSAAAGIGASLSPLIGAAFYAKYNLQVALFAYSVFISLSFIINMIFVPNVYNYVDSSSFILGEANTTFTYSEEEEIMPFLNENEDQKDESKDEVYTLRRSDVTWLSILRHRKPLFAFMNRVAA